MSDPPTEELKAIQTDREATERDLAEQAEEKAEERTHERRAERAAYLKEKLGEQAESLDE